jgi:hypothetical protein
MLLLYTRISYSFLKSNIPHKIMRKEISYLNNDIYNDLYNDIYPDIYSDIFDKKHFLNNEISCYAINFPGPDNLKICKNCKHFTPNDIKTLVAKNGMEVERVLPMVFDSFYVSLLTYDVLIYLWLLLYCNMHKVP